MRNKLFAVVASLLMVTFVLAAENKVIDPSDGAALEAAKGQNVSLTGKVAKAEWSKSGKVMNIEFENADKFVAAAFDRNRAKLDEAFSGDLAKSLQGAKVTFTGKLEAFGGKAKAYEGRLQLVINTSNQITIVEPAPSTQPTKTE